MPKAALHSALSRQWELLTLLPSRLPGVSVADLRTSLADRGYEVSKRTVARDLEALSLTFPIVSEQRLGADYFAMRPGTHIDLPSMTLAQALSFRLLEDFLRPLLPRSVISVIEPHFGTARDKLGALAGQSAIGALVDKLRVVPPSLPFLPPVVEHGVLEGVQDGLIHRRVCEVEYMAADATEHHRTLLHPLAMVQRGAVTYLVATAYDYHDPRIYSLHRMRSVRVLDDSFETPADFSLDGFIASGRLNFGHGDQITLVMRVKPHLAKYLLESPLSGDMVLQIDEPDVLVTASVGDTWQLKWWLLSMADDLEVVSPPELRQSVAERHRLASLKYAVAPGDTDQTRQ